MLDSAELNKHPKVFKRWKDGYSVRSMTPEDAKLVQQWICDRFYAISFDLELIMDVYPRIPGFYIGEIDGEVVASCVWVRCAHNIFYGCKYYVDPRFRGKGLGHRIKDDVAMGHIGSNIQLADAFMETAGWRLPSLGFTPTSPTKRFEKIVDDDIATLPSYHGRIEEVSIYIPEGL